MDEVGGDVGKRMEQLERWKSVVWSRSVPVTPVECGICDLLLRYPVSPALVEEIILGMEMDLRGQSYSTYADLERYCFRVASAVGLVSIEIFGYTQAGTKDYAIELGHALQMTNILRDVREDWLNGRRLYLPAEDLQRFGVSREEIDSGRETVNFHRLMAFEAERVQARYDRALTLLPPQDRASLRASELMRRLYFSLFRKMQADGFRVLSRRYRLSTWEKLAILLASSFPGRTAS